MIHSVTPFYHSVCDNGGESLFRIARAAQFWLVFIVCFLPSTSAAHARNPKSPLGEIIENDSGRMTKPPLAADGDSPALFYEVLRKSLKKRKTNIENICPSSDAVSRRVLEDYGAIFLADKKVMPPPVCVFTSHEQVVEFQE